TMGASHVRFLAHREGSAVKASGAGLASTFTRSRVIVRARGHDVSFRVRGLGAATRPTAHENRITYRHGNVREWYLNGPLGLEQGCTFARAPGTRHLVVTQTLGGTLAPRQRGQTIVFGSRSDVLRYSGLRAFDARGRSLPARMHLVGRALTLSVEAAYA